MVVQDSLTVNWDVESFLPTTDDDLFQKLPAVLGGKLQKMLSVTFWRQFNNLSSDVCNVAIDTVEDFVSEVDSPEDLRFFGTN